MRRGMVLALALAGCAAPERAVVAPKPVAAPAAKAPAAVAPAPAPSPEARLVELSVHGPDAKSFPQADAVVILDRDEVTLEKDGRVVEKHHSIVRILEAQRGKAKFADVHVPYDSERQVLAIETARTANADGVHAASAEEISDIVPQELRDATIYSGARERVVSFPAVDKGSVLELAYTRTTIATPDAALGDELMLADWDPVVARVVTVTAPEGVTPHLEVQGVTLAPVESHDAAAGTHTFTFSLADQPDRQWEVQGMPEAAVLPRLVYSFLPDWDAAIARVAPRYLGLVRADKPDASIADTARRLTARARGDEERAAALLRFVAQDVRSVHLPLGAAGYAPHAPEVVLRNLYGDDRDKVGLFVALCAAVGLEAQPVLVRRGGVPVLEGAPTVAQFDRMIARVDLGGHPSWVDPADENAWLGAGFTGAGTFALVLAPGKSALERRPLAAPEASVSRLTTRLALDENGTLSATYQYAFTGSLAVGVAGELRRLKGEHLDKRFQDAALTVSAAAVDVSHSTSDLNAVSGALEVTHAVKVPGYATAQGDFRVVQLPSPSLGYYAGPAFPGTSERRSSMSLGTPRTWISDTTLALPAGWKVAAFPAPLEGSVDGFRYKFACSLEGRTLHCQRELSTSVLELTPKAYAAYHDAYAKLLAYQERVVLLTR